MCKYQFINFSLLFIVSMSKFINSSVDSWYRTYINILTNNHLKKKCKKKPAITLLAKKLKIYIG